MTLQQVGNGRLWIDPKHVLAVKPTKGARPDGTREYSVTVVTVDCRNIDVMVKAESLEAAIASVAEPIMSG